MGPALRKGLSEEGTCALRPESARGHAEMWWEMSLRGGPGAGKLSGLGEHHVSTPQTPTHPHLYRALFPHGDPAFMGLLLKV